MMMCCYVIHVSLLIGLCNRPKNRRNGSLALWIIPFPETTLHTQARGDVVLGNIITAMQR